LLRERERRGAVDSMKRLLTVGLLATILAFFGGVGLPVGDWGPAAGGEVAFAEDADPTPTGDGEPVDDEGPRKRTWIDNLKAAGACGIVQILLSIVALALIIEDFVNIRRDRMMPPHILSELEQLFEEEDYEEALNLCDAEDCFLTRIVGAGLAKQEDGYEMMAYAMEEQGEDEALNLNAKLSYVALIAMIEPMLGLFGTVLGMIGAFSKIAEMAGAASAADLAGDISMALVTTFLGLLIAIPILGCHTVLRNRVMKLLQEGGMITGELFSRFRQAA